MNPQKFEICAISENYVFYILKMLKLLSRQISGVYGLSV